MKKKIRESLAEFIVKTRYEKLPEEVIHQAKRCMLDFLGVALAGSKVGIAPTIADIICAMGGKEEATIIGDGRKIPILNAVFLNSVKGHTLDMDDCQRYASGHPGIVAIPAAIGIGEKENVGGKTLIEAIVVGYEIFLRIASLINPSHLGRGFHTTGTVGPFAAAAASSKILGLNEEEIENAISIAGLQGAGLLEVATSGQMMKPLQAGRAVQGGTLASLLAKQGARGPDLIFEGEKGFLRAFSDISEMDSLLKNLGKNFEIMTTAFKLYAACRVSHPSVDATLEICKKEGLGKEDIKSIEIETFRYALKLCGDIVYPDTPLAAKFSISYSIALAIFFGDLFMYRFTEENIKDKGIKELASKVKVSVGEEWERSYPEKKGATVTIRTRSGKFYSSSVSLPRGEPENSVSLEDLMAKFRSNSILVISEQKSMMLMENILNLENLTARNLARLFF
jgi:2-methylcitrate dehydratase PrpD